MQGFTEISRLRGLSSNVTAHRRTAVETEYSVQLEQTIGIYLNEEYVVMVQYMMERLDAASSKLTTVASFLHEYFKVLFQMDKQQSSTNF